MIATTMPARRGRPPKAQPVALSMPSTAVYGNVIFLPTFGLPKIENPVFRGLKKGCPSLGNARRKKKHVAGSCTTPPPVRVEIVPPAPIAACKIQRAPPTALLAEFCALYQTADDQGADSMLCGIEFAVIYEKKCREKGNQ